MLIPVILFAYARPDHLNQTLDGLRANQVPLIYAFSDGPKGEQDASKVMGVRKILRSIDWCEVRLTERETNLGLGRSILVGVTEVLRKFDAIIVFEDDLICVPGTYNYLCAALEHYRDDTRVMSVTGWTHPLITPSDVIDQPYFDGRAESLAWGTWGRAWDGMATDAKTLMKKYKAEEIDIYKYGADLPSMARVELRHNIWAVRFLFWHILNRGLCLRPPWSMVEHIGWDFQGTNAKEAGIWAAAPLRPCPSIPSQWPVPIENVECPGLSRAACEEKPTIPKRVYSFFRRMIGVVLRGMVKFLK
jgi:hypothetical protein